MSAPPVDKKTLKNGRTIIKKLVQFRCSNCNQGIFKMVYPGRTPLYCDLCAPKVAVKAARLRKRRQRARQMARQVAAQRPAPTLAEIRAQAKAQAEQERRWVRIVDFLKMKRVACSMAVIIDAFPGLTREDLETMQARGLIIQTEPGWYSAAQKRSARIR